MKRRSQHTRATTTTRRCCDDDKDNEEKLRLGRFAIEWKRKKKDESSGLITNSERAHDAIDGQMKHKVRAASSSFSSLYPRTCTCACADRPLKLRPLGFFVRSARATTCSTKRVVYRCLVDISNRIFHAFQRFLDSRFHVYHRPLHAAPSFSLALLLSLLSSALRSSTSSCFTFPYI